MHTRSMNASQRSSAPPRAAHTAGAHTKADKTARIEKTGRTLTFPLHLMPEFVAGKPFKEQTVATQCTMHTFAVLCKSGKVPSDAVVRQVSAFMLDTIRANLAAQ